MADLKKAVEKSCRALVEQTHLRYRSMHGVHATMDALLYGCTIVMTHSLTGS